MGDLQDLVRNRQSLLLAEVAAWLHDVGKLANIHIEHHTSGKRRWGNPGSYKVIVSDPKRVLSPICSNSQIRTRLGRRLGQILANNHPTLFSELSGLLGGRVTIFESQITSQSITMAASFSIAELIMLGLPGSSKPKDIQTCFGRDGWLPAALGIAHGVAHHDKQDGDGRQIWPDIYSSTAFGWETSINDLDSHLKQIPITIDHTSIRQFAFTHLRSGLGDTRRPVNEVTLLDWAWTVASLYKSVLAQAILGGRSISIQDRNHHQLQWRLLSVRTDGLGWLLSSPSIPDLKARQDLLRDALNKVQTLLEETYPLGLEVYRDENGSVFVVPDIEHLDTALVDSVTHKTLRQYILETFAEGTVQNDPSLALKGEIVPEVYVDREPWKGQPAPKELPPISKNWKNPNDKGHLEREVHLTADPQFVASAWSHRHEEICTVCGLRPQGPSRKARDRKVCDVCEERRADRAREWVANIGRAFMATIWLDEVADTNGRLALIVGTFDLEHWLSGDLVRTLAVREPNDKNGRTVDQVAKNPSFARLRRIWETTRRFWEEVAPTDPEADLSASLLGQATGQAGPRLKIALAGIDEAQLGEYHAYELVLPQGVSISVVWDSEQNYFISAENLVYVARLLGKKPPKDTEDLHQWAAETVQREVNNTQIILQEPTGYGGRNRDVGRYTVSETLLEGTYTPIVSILAEPQTFMALVPADKALEVVRAIKTKYEREMGKVRNRLPLHLGLVFADAHLPLRVILDAGRQMLKQDFSHDGWVVKAIRLQPNDGGALPKRFLEDKNGQFKQWLEVDLEQDGRRLTWYIPSVMGDGQTEDRWYPYVFLTDEPTNRTRYYKAPNPWKKAALSWLVHAAELRPSDKVYFTPATFDFIWLDTGGTRFEIAYDEQGHRRGTLCRPYLLDELDDLMQCWRLLAGEKKDGLKIERLSGRQLHIVRDLIESKRAEWFDDPRESFTDPNFRTFCHSVLSNAEWKEMPEGNDLEKLTNWAVSGLLADAVELFYHIMKQRPVSDEKG